MNEFWITKEELFAYMAAQTRLARMEAGEDIDDMAARAVIEDTRGRLALFLQEAVERLTKDEEVAAPSRRDCEENTG